MIYTVNFVEYLQFTMDLPVSYKNYKELDKLDNKIKKHNGIWNYAIYRYSFFGKSTITVKFLIPSSEAVSFSNTKLGD